MRRARRPAHRYPGTPLPFLLSARYLPWHTACILIDSLTTCLLLYVPTTILESWPGSGDACGQALCKSLVIAPTPLQSPVLVPVAGPSPAHGSASLLVPAPRPRLWLHCKLHLQSQFTVCTLLLLSQLNPSSLPDPQPDFRISLCLLSLLRPSHHLPCGACTCTTSTRFPPIGTCSDLTATPKQNSGQTHLSPTTSSKPLGARIDTCENHLLSHPGPSSSFFLFVFWKRAPRVSLASTESISFRL